MRTLAIIRMHNRKTARHGPIQYRLRNQANPVNGPVINPIHAVLKGLVQPWPPPAKSKAIIAALIPHQAANTANTREIRGLEFWGEPIKLNLSLSHIYLMDI